MKLTQLYEEEDKPSSVKCYLMLVFVEEHPRGMCNSKDKKLEYGINWSPVLAKDSYSLDQGNCMYLVKV